MADLNKTQFLVEHVFGAVGTRLRSFKRKRGLMLMAGDKPLRRIDSDQWEALKKAWPEECEADGLNVRVVWFLVPMGTLP